MYRTKLTPADEKDVPTLVANLQAWDVLVLINVFQSLVSKSRINEQLVAIRNGEDPVTVAGHFGCRTLYKMLGYFSLVGLLRLHSLLGDYHTALRSFENVELNKKGLYSRVPKCQITIFYYVGFAYMMMRRYQDSVRMFAGILTYILRTQPYHTRSSGYDFLIKKKDHLLALLAIVLVLAPQRIDDALHTQLLEKHGEKMVKMQRGDDSVFPVVQELFSIGCPKFVSPVISAPRIQTAKENSSLDPLKLQMKLFLTEVTQQVLTPFVRSYLKLYSTMPIVKLAAFLNLDVESFRIALHNYKHKTSSLVWTSGTPLDGDRVPASDVDFYIDGDMIHIADIKVARCYGEYFINQIIKMSSSS